MIDPVQILLIEGDGDAEQEWRAAVRAAPANIYTLETARTLEEGFFKLGKGNFDVVALDPALSGTQGMREFLRIRALSPEMPVILFVEEGQEEWALQALHEGAHDYMVRGRLSIAELARSIRYATERKMSQMALTRAEEKYRSIFENIVEGIFQTTPHGRYLNANPALARIYGYASSSELKSKLTNIGEELYVEPGRRVEFVQLMEKNDVVIDFESRIYRKDGSIIWISENVRAVRDGAGVLKHYEGTVEDITSKRQAEEALRNSETLYHSLVETLPQNIFRKDLQERFTFANKRFCETLGKPLAEILGKTDFDFFPAAMAAKFQKDDRLIIETGRMFEAVEENQPPGGEKLYVNVVKTPLYSATGEIIGLQGIFWDITEKKRAEERVRKATQELAESREELREKNGQMEEDLRMARDIQQAMIPSQYPSFPKNAQPEASALRFCHRYIPTGAVGGDFFNVLAFSDTKAGVFICDVMGHGVRSALVTAILRALVEELTRHAKDPGELLTQINRDLRSILNTGGTPLYTTAFYMVVDLEARQIHYANAGHPKPVIARRNTGEIEFMHNNSGKSYPALGLLPDATYPTSMCGLWENDMVVMFTDGVYDFEKNGELLSAEWLRDQIKSRMNQPLSPIFDGILAELKGDDGAECEDDICLVGMEIAGTLPS